ncbi:MAG: hypothetical protein JO319_02110 [Acidobacteriaceae bacterium]|nr:hypothetical protein [Acidobacteriaceae bacterium]
MSEPILCKICAKRRARRACPAVRGDICTTCCGTEREVSLSCPLDCVYLMDAHQHEKPVPVAPGDIANRDVEVSEEFLQSHEEFLLYCTYSLLQAALRTPGAIDSDVMTALDALIQTYRTLSSGLIYETRPENNVAASVQRIFIESVEEYQNIRAEREGLGGLRNSEILATLVFLHRLGQQNQNGKPRGRMFLDLLKHLVPQTTVQEQAPSIIL